MTVQIGQIGYNPSSLFNAQDILKFAKLLDINANVDSIWMPESWGREAFVMLGAISALTNRIKLGTSIVSIFSRTPATSAMAASTLDNISLNRAIIGIGASTPILAESWHGIKFEHPLQRMKEYVACFNIITSGETINYNGKFFKLKNIKLMHPSSRKKIPVFLGAVNSGMIRLATEIADGTILYLRPYVAVGKYYNEFLSSHGFENEVNQITNEYQKHGIENIENISKFVTDSMLEALTIYGTVDECIKSLKRFSSCGLSLPILQINPVKDNEQSIKDSLLLAENV